MFEEKEEFDVTVKSDGVLEVRKATVVLKDGEEILRSYHRNVVEPGEDLTEQPDIVRTIAPAVWTEEMVAKIQLRNEAHQSK